MAGMDIAPDGLTDEYGEPIGAANPLAVTATLTSPVTAFGELLTAQITPVVQMDAVNGARPKLIVVREEGTGAAGDDDQGQFEVRTGVGAPSLAMLRSRRRVRYRPGQGVVGEFTAIFDDHRSGVEQVAGLYNSTTALGFGLDGVTDTLAILHRTGGEVHCEKVTITAPSGGGTVTLTLDGVAYAIPVTSTADVHVNAYEIAEWMADTANQIAWSAASVEGVVTLLAVDTGVRSGAYSISSTGTLTATMVMSRAGLADIDHWVPQAEWNLDTMDGAGPSGAAMDRRLGNIFKIDLQYLGYGGILFSVEDRVSARWVPVHMLRFASTRLFPTLRQPSFATAWWVRAGVAGTDVVVLGASAMGGVQGLVVPAGPPDGAASSVAGVGVALTSIIAIRVKTSFRCRALQNEVRPLLATAAIEGSKNGTVRLLVNPTFSAPPLWEDHDPGSGFVDVAAGGQAIATAGREIAPTVLAGGTGVAVDLGAMDTYLQAGDVLCVACEINGPGSDVSAAITWRDD